MKESKSCQADTEGGGALDNVKLAYSKMDVGYSRGRATTKNQLSYYSTPHIREEALVCREYEARGQCLDTSWIQTPN